MTILVLVLGGPKTWQSYRAPLAEALAQAGVAADLVNEAHPETVDYIVYAPYGDTPADFRPFTRCKAVLSLWAGVERIVTNPTLTQPLCRMVDPGLERGMTEWVTGQVLRHHLGLDALLASQDGVWRNGVFPPLAADRPVGVLGLGELGRSAARALAGIGFDVMGWSRRPAAVAGVDCRHGPEGLDHILRRAQIIVTLLPHTPQTESLIDAAALARMPAGAVLINPGRGALVDEPALLDALDRGHLGHATLDVFRTEPLPPDHPFWAHSRVTVSPHVAATTRPGTASPVIAENIRRGEAGEPFLHLVDRVLGY
jgi:glyoxylate/hydroxypyruvate reductase